MTDHELLELAAKAAEVKHNGRTKIGGLRIPEPLERYPDAFICWDPLTDDGDALRLAVKLHIHITISDYGKTVTRQGSEFRAIEEHDSDPYAATRRAIVRAAAEIGNGMK